MVLRMGDLPVGLQAFAVIAGVLSLVVAAANYAHDPDRSLRRLFGWILAVFGSLIVCGVLGWWLSKGLSRNDAGNLITTIAIGILLACVGVVVATRTRASDLPQLRATADAVEGHIHQLDANDGFDRARYVAMSVQAGAGISARRMKFTRLLNWPVARLTVVRGGRGCGKSINLRQVALKVCEQAKRRRRPRQMVVHVDLRVLAASTEALTQKVVHEHLRAAVRAHDGAAVEFLEQHLERPRGLRWLFIFDSIDVLDGSEWQPNSGDPNRQSRQLASEKYLSLIEQLVKHRRDFRAIVAIRQVPVTRSFAGSVLTVADLSVRQQRALLHPFSITSVTHRSVFDRLAHDPAIADFAASPLLLNMLGKHLRATGALDLKRTCYEILEGIIDLRLQNFGKSESGLGDADAQRAAESISYRMFAECIGRVTLATQPLVASPANATAVITSDPAIVTLVEAGLGRFDQSGFEFSHQLVQVYFAASHLLRGESQFDYRKLITVDWWQDVLINALQAGSTEMRAVVTAAAADVLSAEVTSSELVPDVKEYLKNEQSPIVPGSFSWPPIARHVLRVLRNGLRFESAVTSEQLAVTEAADRLILTAVAAGGLAAKKEAIDFLPMTSPDVGVWVATRGLDPEKDELAGGVIQQLAIIPEVFRRLGVATQLAAVAGAISAKLVGFLLSRRSVVEDEPGTLPRALFSVLRVTQVFALVLILWAIGQVMGTQNPFMLAVGTLLILAAAAFLYDSRAPGLRGLTNIGYVAVLILAIAAVLAAFFGILSALGTIIVLLLRFDVGKAFENAVWAYVSLWPLAMAVYVVADSSTARTDRFQEWLLPHVRLARMTLTWLQEKKVRAAILATITPRRVTAVGVFLLLLIVASINLPGINATSEERIDIFLTLAGLVVLFGFAGKDTRNLRQINWWKLWRKRLPKVVDNNELLRLLEESGRSRDSIRRLLHALSTADPYSLQHAVPVLTDLDRALEFVKEMVPAKTKTQIPVALWTLGPNFTFPGFRTWLTNYDRRYPGLLTSLASSQRELLSRAVYRARGRADKDESMVFQSLPHGSQPEPSPKVD